MFQVKNESLNCVSSLLLTLPLSFFVHPSTAWIKDFSSSSSYIFLCQTILVLAAVPNECHLPEALPFVAPLFSLFCVSQICSSSSFFLRSQLNHLLCAALELKVEGKSIRMNNEQKINKHRRSSSRGLHNFFFMFYRTFPMRVWSGRIEIEDAPLRLLLLSWNIVL